MAGVVVLTITLTICRSCARIVDDGGELHVSTRFGSRLEILDASRDRYLVGVDELNGVRLRFTEEPVIWAAVQPRIFPGLTCLHLEARGEFGLDEAYHGFFVQLLQA